MLQYPKLCLLLLSFLAAYVLYHMGAFDWLGQMLNGYGYASIFLGGMLFSFGFTAPFGIAIFLEVGHSVHPLIAAPLAGIGALLADLSIFSLMRFSIFHDEMHRLGSSRMFQSLHALLHHERLSDRLRHYLLWAFAGIVIASPLPDEFGVSLVSGISHIKTREFAFLCFSLNTAGILLILLATRAVH